MILYHVTTLYQLLYVICHRMTVHRDRPCCLFLSEYLLPEMKNRDLLNRLEENGWFSFVRVIPEISFKLKRGGALDETSRPEEIDAMAEAISHTFEKWLDLDLRQMETLYVASDQWSLGVYLLHNRIPYVYIEDGSGMLSQPERYLAITKKFNLSNFIICNHLHGAGRSPLVTACLCDLKNQLPGFHDDRAVNFSVYEAVRSMPEKDRAALLDFYGITPIKLDPNQKTCLFLTQYLETLAENDLETQEYLSTLLADYFAPDFRLLVKPHPKDKWLDYRRVFPKSEILPREVNAELLPFVFDSPPQLAITISSTAVGGLAPFVGRTCSLGTAVEKDPESLHLFYALARILQFLNSSGEQTYRGVSRTAAECFQSMYKSGKDGPRLKVLVDSGVCESDENQTGPYGLCVFLGTAPYTNGVTEEKLSGMMEVTVRVTPEEGSIARPYFHRISVSSRDASLLEKLGGLRIRCPLSYTHAICEISAHRRTEREARLLCSRYNKMKRSYLNEIQIRRLRSHQAE
ncbi:MAG: glycosyltransferase family 52 [Candidatus Heritagella sp.]